MSEEALLIGIPGTSLWGLKARAQEDQRPDGLFKDTLAQAWFQKLEPYFGGALERWYNPVLQQAIALRTDILDRAVKEHIAQHPKAVIVELGAGFSTRFHRLQPACAWYELDLPEVIELRLSMREPEAVNHWYLADSIFSSDWMQELRQHEPEQLLLIAEGLLMYFPLDRVENLFETLHQQLKGAWIAFDTMGSGNLKAAQDPGQEVDAPIYWGMPNLEQACRHFGLEAAGDLSLPSQLRLHAHYRKRLSFITRWLLNQRWLTARQGGSILARIQQPASGA